MKLKKLMHDFLQDYLDQNKIEFSEWGVIKKGLEIILLILHLS